MKLEKALINCEIKKTGENEYEFIMSDETIDRDDEVILVDGWDLKNFKKNNILLWGHRHDLPGIGVVGSAIKEDGKLKAKKVRFASPGVYDLADTVHGLVDDGVLKAVSVGYIPKEREYPSQNDEDKGNEKKKKPRVVTTKAELYELSIVNVGANANALRAMKDAEEQAVKDFTGDEKLFFPGEKAEPFELDEKPYKNEHSCHLTPANYPKYRRENCKAKHDDKCIDFIYGIKGENDSELHAMRYPKKIWTASAARAHCRSKKGTFEAAADEDSLTVEEMEEKFDEIKSLIEGLAEKIENKEQKPGKYEAVLAVGEQSDKTAEPEQQAPFKPAPKPHVFKIE